MLSPNSVRLIAFYLPQFHPVPENDEWWGPGFTEWTNVSAAKPLFRGHRQPRIPGDLGYYDLRLPETQQAQAELARHFGIEGFCYWHYWFHGRRFLERPVKTLLERKAPDFPFCLAWANESLSRNWLGNSDEILLEQTYSPEDYRAHGRWLAEVFSDPRYIRVHGRPLFLVYRPTDLLPNPQLATDIFREESLRAGLAEPYLVGMDARWPRADMRAMGFDMTEHHGPQFGLLGDEVLGDKIRFSRLRSNLNMGVFSHRLKLFQYADLVERMVANRPRHPHFPCCFVGWDNTPRRGKQALVITGATPKRFGAHLTEMVSSVRHKVPEERVVFINAWNEWAEGMYLEPDRAFGQAFLEEVLSVVEQTAVVSDSEQSVNERSRDGIASGDNQQSQHG